MMVYERSSAYPFPVKTSVVVSNMTWKNVTLKFTSDAAEVL